MKPGDLVWYYPSLPGPGFSAVVDGEPWTLCGTEVVRLRDLPKEYSDWTGRRRSTVPAAAVSHLRPRSEHATFPVIHAERMAEPWREPPARRFFKIDTDGSTPTWCIVATNAGAAWRAWAESIANAGEGEDMLTSSVRMVELEVDAAAAKNVNDDGRRYPLTEAELGAVFCSEY